MLATHIGISGFKRIITVLLFTAVSGTLLFTSAGTLHWFRGWIYLAACFVCVTVAGLVMAVRNPEALNARGKKHRDIEPFDKLFAISYVALLIALPVTAGLDAVRFARLEMPAALSYAGLLVFLLAEIPILWSMQANPFLETGVRIQRDRGHHTIQSGPYRFVRHPMYAGLIFQNLAAPLILGSTWAFAPAFLIAAFFIWRADREDRFLRQNLPGYADYARVTRYLLVPGVW